MSNFQGMAGASLGETAGAVWAPGITQPEPVCWFLLYVAIITPGPSGFISMTTANSRDDRVDFLIENGNRRL